MQFVVQEHHARTHHFDFRLEHAGVFKSWAVPKGIPDRPGIARLAIAVEDHDLSFGEFEGTLPEGEYGAGDIRVWDSGPYETVRWDEHEIVVDLSGHRIRGRYRMVPMSNRRRPEWLIMMLMGDDSGTFTRLSDRIDN